MLGGNYILALTLMWYLKSYWQKSTSLLKPFSWALFSQRVQTVALFQPNEGTQLGGLFWLLGHQQVWKSCWRSLLCLGLVYLIMSYIFDKHILGKENVEVKGRGWEGNTFCLLLLERLNSELMAIRLNKKRYVSAKSNRKISLQVGGMLMTCYSLFDGNLNLLWYLVASIFQFFICFDKEKILCCCIQLCSSW